MINDIDQSDFVVIMGDFNAKVGDDWENSGGALGKFGVDGNYSGGRLIQYANVNDLVVTNTCFSQVINSRLWTWESPDGRTHNMVDHYISQKKMEKQCSQLASISKR